MQHSGNSYHRRSKEKYKSSVNLALCGLDSNPSHLVYDHLRLKIGFNVLDMRVYDLTDFLNRLLPIVL